MPPPGRINSGLRSLFDEMYRDPSFENGSRRISLTSRDTPGRRRSCDVNLGRQRSATLESVAESHLEEQTNRDEVKVAERSEVGTGPMSQEVKNDDGGQVQSSSVGNGEGKGSKDSSNGEPDQTGSSASSGKLASSDKSRRKSKRYVDADMQTEIGSQHDGDDTDSGNEADVDSYLENVSFPGSLSRISMVDGPPSKEQIQRNQAQYMAQHLVQAALLAGAKDNITVMVALLPGCGL